jgi:hypothetical protein
MSLLPLPAEEVGLQEGAITPGPLFFISPCLRSFVTATEHRIRWGPSSKGQDKKMAKLISDAL